MARHEDRGVGATEAPKKTKKARRQEKRRHKRALEDAQYDCELDEGRDISRIPLFGYARELLGDSHWVDEDDAD